MLLYYAFVSSPGDVSTATGGVFRFDDDRIIWEYYRHADATHPGAWIPDSRLIAYTVGDDTRDVIAVSEGQAHAISLGASSP